MIGILSIAALFSACTSGVSAAPSTTNKVIAQMFEWDWDSVAAECTSFLGPAGYGFVQTSPATEHTDGPEWSSDYEVVSYNITSKRGNREQYANMVQACHAAGVGIIQDTIMNHMCGNHEGVGVGGSAFSHYTYEAVPYHEWDFHHCGNGIGDVIDSDSYQNVTEVQTCELDSLADLRTETEYVRATLAWYANDLLSLGVDGFRLDAALFIASDDIHNITSRLTNTNAYITQEAHSSIDNPEAIQPQAYVQNGDVQNFYYTDLIKAAFESGDIAQLQNLDDKGWIASDTANVFVANHDTERHADSLNHTSPSNTYINAMVYSLAHPYGTPTILSSYAFNDITDGAPNSGKGSCDDGSGWLCQHRTMGGMVGFRNTVQSAGLTNWYSPSNERIAFSRGNAGFVAINNGDASWSETAFVSGLPAGRYCNVGPGVAQCDVTSSFTVNEDGSLAATIGARSAIAFHTGAMSTA